MSNSFVTPWTIAHWSPLSMGFPKQEYWSGLPFPSSGDLPHPGIKPKSLAWQADSLSLSHWEAQGKPENSLLFFDISLLLHGTSGWTFPSGAALVPGQVVHCTRQASERTSRGETPSLFCSLGLVPGAWLYPSRRVFSLKISKATILLRTWVTAGLRLLKGMIF